MPTAGQPSLDRTSRRLLIVTAVPVILAMVHLARKGTSVSFPTRRPGGATPFTWEESPLSFILYGVMAYLVTCCIVLICKPFVQLLGEKIRPRRRSRR